MNLANLSLLAQEAVLQETIDAGLLSGFTSDQRFVLMLSVIGCVTVIIITLAAIYAGVTSGIHRRNAEADLKRDMLDRGMSAEEIAQVVESTPPTDFLERWASKGSGRRR